MPRALPTYLYLLLFMLLVGVNVSFYRAVFASPALEIKTLSVGESLSTDTKGSATLVYAPGGVTILIDTGSDASVLRALGNELPPWQRRIDLLVLTSAKKASIGGLPDVLSRYAVGKQITINRSQRVNFDEHTYIDITLTPDAPASVSVSKEAALTKAR